MADRSQLDRAVSLPISDTRDAFFVSPEDVIIKKMEYYREGGSGKHLRDIAGIVRLLEDRLDRQMIERQATALGLGSVWRAICQRVGL
jgi:hypothetical protein